MTASGMKIFWIKRHTFQMARYEGFLSIDGPPSFQEYFSQAFVTEISLMFLKWKIKSVHAYAMRLREGLIWGTQRYKYYKLKRKN